MSTKTLRLRLRRLYPAQQEIARNARRFNVLACGRRWGKTTYGIERLITPALDGAPVAYFAPTYGMVTEVWREYVRLLRPVAGRMNASDHRIELVTGGVLDMWSLDSPDAARGRKYARIVVDEAAMVPNLVETFNLVLRPTLADYSGGADFYSTPRGFNDFYTLFQRGQDGTPDWASWQQPTAMNPYIPPSEIDAMRAEMTSLQYSQEVLAQFVNLEGGLFRREWFRMLDTRPADVPRWVRFWDLATSVKQTADYTSGALLGQRSTGALVVGDMVHGRWEWPDTRRIIIQTAHADGKSVPIGVEAAAFQLAAVQDLQRDPALVGYTIRPVTPDKDKQARAMPWASRAEAGLVELVRGPWLTGFLNELSDFPQGEHDDQVDAVSGAVQLLAHAGSRRLVTF